MLLKSRGSSKEFPNSVLETSKDGSGLAETTNTVKRAKGHMPHPTDASQDSLHAGSPSDHTQEIHTSHQENDSPKEHSKPSKDLRCEWCFQNVNQTLAWDLWMLVFSIWSNIKQHEIHSFERPLKQNSGIKFWGFQLPVSSTSAPENSNDACSLHDERCFDWKCLSWLVCHCCVSCRKMLKRYLFKRGIMWSLFMIHYYSTQHWFIQALNPIRFFCQV